MKKKAIYWGNDKYPSISHLIDMLETSPENFESSVEKFGKISRNTEQKFVFSVSDFEEGFAFFFKVWKDRGIIRYAKNLYRGGGYRAIREANGMLTLRSLGLNTPELLVSGYIRHGLTRTDSFLATKEIINCVALRLRLKETPVEDAKEILSRFSADLAKLHKAGYVYGDPNYENVLWARDDIFNKGRLYYIDTMGVRNVGNNRHMKLKDIARVVLYFQRLQRMIEEGLSEHFLYTYFLYSNWHSQCSFQIFLNNVNVQVQRMKRLYKVRRFIYDLG